MIHDPEAAKAANKIRKLETQRARRLKKKRKGAVTIILFLCCYIDSQLKPKKAPEPSLDPETAEAVKKRIKSDRQKARRNAQREESEAKLRRQEILEEEERTQAEEAKFKEKEEEKSKRETERKTKRAEERAERLAMQALRKEAYAHFLETEAWKQKNEVEVENRKLKQEIHDLNQVNWKQEVRETEAWKQKNEVQVENRKQEECLNQLTNMARYMYDPKYETLDVANWIYKTLTSKTDREENEIKWDFLQAFCEIKFLDQVEVRDVVRTAFLQACCEDLFMNFSTGLL